MMNFVSSDNAQLVGSCELLKDILRPETLVDQPVVGTIPSTGKVQGLVYLVARIFLLGTDIDVIRFFCQDRFSS